MVVRHQLLDCGLTVIDAPLRTNERDLSIAGRVARGCIALLLPKTLEVEVTYIVMPREVRVSGTATQLQTQTNWATKLQGSIQGLNEQKIRLCTLY